jgi:hypothetical protein
LPEPFLIIVIIIFLFKGSTTAAAALHHKQANSDRKQRAEPVSELDLCLNESVPLPLPPPSTCVWCAD